jgi:transglutaminase-like putative cysteine protease
MQLPASLQGFQKFMPPRVPLVTEDSKELRTLVQVLVGIGIVATDVASGAFEQMFQGGGVATSLWAIPVSIVGAVLSWYQRREGRILIKFLLAIAMLVALGIFFLNISGTPNDTRLGLAFLLIHLQVIHSFDLPRRKDLGYSMAIGLVLLGVSATLSQTLAFAPWLIAFVVIAIPMLLLDYRSRLGLSPATMTYQRLPWRILGLITVASFTIGGVIFALLPRLPGYQLRGFPVSTELPLPKNMSSRIRNPGFPSQLAKGGKPGDPKNKNGQQNVDLIAKSYYGFNEEVSFENAGFGVELQPALMMRVRSQGASFWRMMAFDEYTGRGWRVKEGSKNMINLYRQPPFNIIYLPNNALGSKYESILQTFTMTEDLPNLIPAAPWGNELYFPVRTIAVDSVGNLRSPVDLVKGLTYTVVSAVPDRDREQLARSGQKYPRALRERYLQLPPTISPRVRALAQQITQAAPNRYDKALLMSQYLKQNYRLASITLPLSATRDVADAFLFGTKAGTPEHFATTEVVMLRSLGIPARLVTGFLPGKYNPWTGYYEVWNTDATAMVEAYFPSLGWFGFDPVPGRDLLPPSPDRTKTFGVAEQTLDTLNRLLPQPIKIFFGYAFGWVGSLIAFVFAWASSLVIDLGWVGGAILAGITTLFVLLGWGAVQSGQWWLRRRRLYELPPPERLYRQMLNLLAPRGLIKLPHQTPLEFLTEIATHSPQLTATCKTITTNYMRWRYRGDEPEHEVEAALVTLRQQLQQTKFTVQ